MIFGIGLAIMAIVPVSQPTQIAGLTTPERDGRQAVAKIKNDQFIGQITGLADCKWNGSDAAPISGDPVSLGQRYSLASGLMEITYDTGAKVILQGPVQYEIESKNGGFMSAGKLTGKVATETARGLTIRTPTAVVTDLGTEFGVEVGLAGATETEVFVGEVQIATICKSVGNNSDSRILRRGQLAKTDGKEIFLTQGSSSGESKSRFIRVMPTSTPRQSNDAYANLVLAMQPTIYYHMDRPRAGSNDMLCDSSLGARHADLHVTDDFGSPWNRGQIGESLYFHGPYTGDHAFLADYPKVVDDQLSVTAWVTATTYPSSAAWAVIAANWGDDVHGQFCFGLRGAVGDLAVAVSQRDGRQILLSEGEAHPFPLAEWQHVTFVMDKSTIRLYRNGVQTATKPCDGLLANSPMRSLMIGNKSDNTGLKVISSYRNDWHGRIDEFAPIQPIALGGRRSPSLRCSRMSVPPCVRDHTRLGREEKQQQRRMPHRQMTCPS